MARNRVRVTIGAIVFCLAAFAALRAIMLEPAFENRAIHEGAARQWLEQLRESINSDDCGRIHVEASHVFRELETCDDWVATCNDMRAKFGKWESVALQATNAGPAFVIHGHGAVIFSRGAGGECISR